MKTPFGNLNVRARTFDFEVACKKPLFCLDGIIVEHPLRVLMVVDGQRLEVASIYNPDENSLAVDLDMESLRLVHLEARFRSTQALNWRLDNV